MRKGKWLRMKKEIGSNFWLDRTCIEPAARMPAFEFAAEISDSLFLSTGRSAISFALSQFKGDGRNRMAMLPPFTCQSVVEPFLKMGYEICFYRIDRNLRCHAEELLEDIEKKRPSVLLMHSYFGFDTLCDMISVSKELHSRGITLIEDITHSIFSDHKHLDWEYAVCRLRKWMPLPDGAMLLSKKTMFSNVPTSQDNEMVSAKIEAMHSKFLYMERDIGEKSEYRNKFSEAEELLNKRELTYCISDISVDIFRKQNIGEMKERRRLNYGVLHESLTGIHIIEPVFDKLENNDVPLYFPVYVRGDRKSLQNYLAERNIYAPVIWPECSYCTNRVNKAVEWIYMHILSIPCDQRYSADDMGRIVAVISDYELKETA